jgi:TPR repeat protein
MACGRRDTPRSDNSQAEPSASVIAIAAAMGECEDLAACARECEAGVSDRCRRMGVNYEFGKRVDRDERQATQLYAEACEMRNPEACVSAGRMYEFHHGVVKDDAKAVSFYRKSCDLDDPTGCANLAIMLETGHGVEKDQAKAVELFDLACKKGAGLACERMKTLKLLLEAGASPPRPPAPSLP